MNDVVQLGDMTVMQGDCLAVLPTLAAHSIHLIILDPPYYKTKLEYLGERVEWDRQWPTREAYLGWIGQLAKECQRVLAVNGSVYWFASPQLAAWVEVTLSGTFHVLNHLVWRKHDGSGAGTGGHSKVCKEALMSYFPQTERIIFCEQYGSDRTALGESGYQAAERQLKTSLFSAPIAEAMRGTGTTAKQVTEAIGAYGKVNHGGAVSNWVLGLNIPTKAQYEAMCTYFNSLARQEYSYLRQEYSYLRQEYEDLRQEYEDLRQEYEDLRQEYEDLRRPFTVSKDVPYTDCFDFATVPAHALKHPCQKPLPLLRHLISCSSRQGDTVLDPTAGSFATLEAAKQLGRKGIGIERDPALCTLGISILSQECLF